MAAMARRALLLEAEPARSLGVARAGATSAPVVSAVSLACPPRLPPAAVPLPPAPSVFSPSLSLAAFALFEARLRLRLLLRRQMTVPTIVLTSPTATTTLMVMMIGTAYKLVPRWIGCQPAGTVILVGLAWAAAALALAA